MEYKENWLEKVSSHYIFHYMQESYAELFIDDIINEQEACFRDITELLKIIPDKKIHYWLCDSRKSVAKKAITVKQMELFVLWTAFQIYFVYIMKT